MASKYAGEAVSTSDNDWRAESDHRTLMNACEIMADRLRMRGVMRHHEKTTRANSKMASILSSFRRGKSPHRGGY